MFDSSLFLKNAKVLKDVSTNVFCDKCYKIDIMNENVLKVHNMKLAVYMQNEKDILVTKLPENDKENIKVFFDVDNFIRNHQSLKDAC